MSGERPAATLVMSSDCRDGGKSVRCEEAELCGDLAQQARPDRQNFPRTRLRCGLQCLRY